MKKILIVEDHADIRKLIRMTLELEDYAIIEATHAAEGLALAEAELPDLCLLDVMMPGEMNGLALCRHLKQHPVLGRRPVVLLTARGQAADIEAGREAGADLYLVKPFGPLQLIEALHALLGHDGG